MVNYRSDCLPDMDTKMTQITSRILAGNYPAFIKRMASRIALWDAYRRK